jgi:hypothetical protein
VNTEPVIVCPKCKTEIKLTESLSAPMVERVRAEYEERLRAQGEMAHKQQEALKARESLLEATISNRVREREEDLRTQARMQAQAMITSAEEEAAQLRESLRVAQQAQAEALRKERELEGRERAITLTIEQGITAGVRQAEERARREADDAARLKRMELEATITSMQVKLAEAQQKAEQGSQQLQGEVQELDLEAALHAKFPYDTLSEIAKGINGADVQQVVISPSGAQCGVILWESKRTKNWSAVWLGKLRDDLRTANADIPVIITQAMPKDVDGFDVVDGVWVCAPKYALALATLLREGLLRVHAVRQAQTGMASKAELIYAYLVGKQFRHRIEAVVEAFTSLQSDLDSEKKAITRAWAKRSAQIENALTATSGLFGDIQGVGGSAIPEIEALNTYALGAGSDV